MVSTSLLFNCGQRPLLMFDGITNAAEPRAFILRRARAFILRRARGNQTCEQSRSPPLPIASISNSTFILFLLFHMIHLLNHHVNCHLALITLFLFLHLQCKLNVHFL